MNQVNVVMNSLGHIVAVQEYVAATANPHSSYEPQAGEVVHTVDVPDDLKKLDLLQLHQSAAIVTRAGKMELVKHTT